MIKKFHKNAGSEISWNLWKKSWNFLWNGFLKKIKKQKYLKKNFEKKIWKKKNFEKKILKKLFENVKKWKFMKNRFHKKFHESFHKFHENPEPAIPWNFLNNKFYNKNIRKIWKHNVIVWLRGCSEAGSVFIFWLRPSKISEPNSMKMTKIGVYQ